MSRVVGNLLLLLVTWWALELLHVGRLMRLRNLRVGGVRRGIMSLRRGLSRLALVRRVRMRLLVLLVLMLVVDSYRPWVMLRVMGWRWQALRRVGVMHVARNARELG